MRLTEKRKHKPLKYFKCKATPQERNRIFLLSICLLVVFGPGVAHLNAAKDQNKYDWGKEINCLACLLLIA